MFYRSYRPAPPLGDFVDYLWLYGDAPSHRKERILPSGTIELVINLRDDELRIDDPIRPGRCERFSGAIVSGPYGGFFTIDAAQQESIMGAHFRPGGEFPFLGPPVDELADRHVDLQALWGPDAIALRERLCGAITPAQRFHLLEAALTAHVVRPMGHHGAVATALDAFRRTEADTTTRDLARSVGLSQRRFIRVFTAAVGLTPKRFRRVQRFQQALALVRQTEAPDWARLAAACAYYDQSHLIHDFRSFSGLSPTAYLRRRSERVKDNHVPSAE